MVYAFVPSSNTSILAFTGIPGSSTDRYALVWDNASSSFTLGLPATNITPGTQLVYQRRPPNRRGPCLFKSGSGGLSVASGTVLNGFLFTADTAVTLPSHSTGTDYAIWQNLSTGALFSDVSFTTAPATATGGVIVGGYFYAPSGRPTAFNSGSPTTSPEILEYSIWDLTFRPDCPDPRGMVCVDNRFWADIFFCNSGAYAGSSFSNATNSRLGQTIADSSSPPLIPAFYGGNGSSVYTTRGNTGPGCWYDFGEVASSFGKRLPSLPEIQTASYGGPEQSARGSDPATTQWERVSKWGLAQATGSMWAITDLISAIDTGNPAIISGTDYTGNRGNVQAPGGPGGIVAVLAGGDWQASTAGGSRNQFWITPHRVSASNITCRFFADLEIAG